MTTRIPTITPRPGGALNTILISWIGLLNGDNGTAWEGADFADRTAQVLGTFGAGGSINLEGSNDGTNWAPLTDPQGNAITKTAASIEYVSELPRFIRPNVTAGDGTTNLTLTVFGRRSR